MRGDIDISIRWRSSREVSNMIFDRASNQFSKVALWLIPTRTSNKFSKGTLDEEDNRRIGWYWGSLDEIPLEHQIEN